MKSPAVRSTSEPPLPSSGRGADGAENSWKRTGTFAIDSRDLDQLERPAPDLKKLARSRFRSGQATIDKEGIGLTGTGIRDPAWGYLSIAVVTLLLMEGFTVLTSRFPALHIPFVLRAILQPVLAGIVFYCVTQTKVPIRQRISWSQVLELQVQSENAYCGLIYQVNPQSASRNPAREMLIVYPGVDCPLDEFMAAIERAAPKVTRQIVAPAAEELAFGMQPAKLLRWVVIGALFLTMVTIAVVLMLH